MLAQRELALRFNNTGVPAWEGHAMRHGWPLATRFIEGALGIRPGIETEDEDAVSRELDFVAERLADGRFYLCGERFGAADPTFAALAGAIVLPPNPSSPPPSRRCWHPKLQRYTRWRDPAAATRGAFADQL